ncbi:MAG: histidine kinase [Lachnospiraceae bacterium]|nr:histidine kinase [Lachnospiraceae bacterium]
MFQALEEKLNNLNFKKKLILFYLFCVLVPLFLTDGIILFLFLRNETAELQNRMENMASAVQYDLSYTLEEAANEITSVYLNRTLNDFLEQNYESTLDFWEASLEIADMAYFATGSTASGDGWMVLYGDNDTIVNGGHFYSLSDAMDTEWYQQLEISDLDMALCFYYVGESDPSASSQRKVCLVRRLNYYKDLQSEKLARMDLDYSTLVRSLTNMNYDLSVYICSGDTILYSNDGHSSTKEDFESFSGNERVGYEMDYSVYGMTFRILVMEPENSILAFLWEQLPWILPLIAVNLLLPLFLTFAINRSLTTRIQELGGAFEQVNSDSLKEIENVRGNDEIGGLMRNYNRMVRRQQELIQAAYKDKLERQEMVLARQRAELLALHSQINPHFLFNVLESIRMHSILKKEDETAEMIERLALLQRQNVNWSEDSIRVIEELRFVDAYLKLQQYRYGERFSYEIELEKECEDLYIPRLTIATFVENACVHGIEKKPSQVWIYIRVYRKDDWVCMEVEDTGVGMEEAQVASILEKMRISEIEELVNSKHVGMINACLRMRMWTKGMVEFELESEKGVGTFFLLRTPIEALEKKEDAYEDEGTAGR